jgi:2-O-A-mannosyl-D-glycerate-specific PTS system IIC component
MELSVLLPKHHILTGIAASGRDDVFRILSAPFVTDGIVTDADAFIADLEHREEQLTTQVDGGVAFPHARSAHARRLGLTIGIAEEPGVVFAAEGEDRCRIFFCIAVPAVAPTAHLPLLSALATFSRDPSKRARLLRDTAPSRILRALSGVRC